MSINLLADPSLDKASAMTLVLLSAVTNDDVRNESIHFNVKRCNIGHKEALTYFTMVTVRVHVCHHIAEEIEQLKNK